MKLAVYAKSCSFLLVYVDHVYSLCSVFEAIPDKLPPDEILRQAQNAVKTAADNLASRAPNSKVHLYPQFLFFRLNKFLSFRCFHF